MIAFNFFLYFFPTQFPIFCIFSPFFFVVICIVLFINFRKDKGEITRHERKLKEMKKVRSIFFFGVCCWIIEDSSGVKVQVVTKFLLTHTRACIKWICLPSYMYTCKIHVCMHVCEVQYTILHNGEGKKYYFWIVDGVYLCYTYKRDGGSCQNWRRRRKQN